MELTEEIDIPGSREVVWAALNDPERLRACLPGCDRFELIDADRYEMEMVAKVGPVKARFRGEVRLSDINPPVSYTLNGSGKGGVAGFAKGGAEVVLDVLEPGVTRMRYTVKAAVGGKIAQLGSRLVEGAARKIAGQFFTTFAESLDAGEN